MEKNKTGKYLKYALSELVLVVIGILIHYRLITGMRKDSIEEKAILSSLLKNLNLSKIQSELLISVEIALKRSLTRILGIDSSATKTYSQIIPDSIFKSAVWGLDSNLPTFNAYNNLKSRHKLNLIKNKKINEKFTKWEFRLNKLKNALDDRLSIHQIRIDNILEKDINFIPLLKSNLPNINIDNQSKIIIRSY